MGLKDISSDTEWKLILSSLFVFRMNVSCNSIVTFLLSGPFFVCSHPGSLRILWTKPQEGTHHFTGHCSPAVTFLLQTTGTPLGLFFKGAVSASCPKLHPLFCRNNHDFQVWSLTSAVTRSLCLVSPILSSGCLVTLTVTLASLWFTPVVKFLLQGLWTEQLPRWIGIAHFSMEKGKLWFNCPSWTLSSVFFFHLSALVPSPRAPVWLWGIFVLESLLLNLGPVYIAAGERGLCPHLWELVYYHRNPEWFGSEGT